MAHRHVRPALGPVAPTTSPRVTEVLAGIAHHTRADAAFHASEVFQAEERTMTRALAGLGVPKLALFGHIAWELCLDGALVRREGPALSSQVREGIARARELAVGEEAVAVAARMHHTARTRGSAELPAGFEDRVGRMLDALCDGDWLAGYANGAIEAERLGGIRARLGLAALAPEAHEALTRVLGDAIDRAGASLEPLLALRIPGDVHDLRSWQPEAWFVIENHEP